MSSDLFQFSDNIAPERFKFPLPLRVTHKFDEFYFDVDYSSNDYGNECFVVTHYPGCGPLEGERYAHQWEEVVEDFGSWIDGIKSELSQPDPWSLLKQDSTLADQVPLHLEGVKFSEGEFTLLHQFLTTIREYIYSEVTPTEIQTQSIDERLAYLESAARRLSKQDWAHIANGAPWTLAMGLALTAEQARHLVALTTDFIKRLFPRLLE